MCGRYTLFTEEETDELRRIVEELQKKNGEVKTGEIFPTNVAPVLIAQDGKPVPMAYTWGFARPGRTGVVINARAETVAEKPMFRACMQNTRCVVPSTGFYEWTKDARKQKYLFRVPKQKALYMAGLWTMGEDGGRFTIVTTAANASVQEVHHRMPVILEEDEIEDWLCNPTAAAEILQLIPPRLEKTAVNGEQMALW